MRDEGIHEHRDLLRGRSEEAMVTLAGDYHPYTAINADEAVGEETG
jgi:hypothetical protein